MRFEVLGPLRAGTTDENDQRGADLPLGGPKQRLVLALLLARPNEVVSTDRLIDDVWGDDVPGTARHTLQGYVSELRKVIGPAIERVGTGYSLRVDTASLDALEFESLVSDGMARAGRDPVGATEQLRHALDLWHGQAFGGFEHHDALATEIARLEELRVAAVEHLMRAELELGRHDAITGALERLTTENPYREELRALHMLALYRCGRQADALRAYQRTARALAEDLGINPSPSLARLEQQILVQDPALDAHIDQELDELAAVTAPAENPYKGLQPFRESDRHSFFGRTALIDQIVAAIDGDARMVTVVGPSGSGKSSVIHAGVVPELRARSHAGGLLIATMQPGAHPFVDLEVALARATEGAGSTLPPLTWSDDGLMRAALRVLPDDSSRLLLVIDQFEELFTLTSDSERAHFLRALATAASDARQRIQVLVALRADFYDRPLQHREFAHLMTQCVVHVLPLSGDELEEAATLPARDIGMALEPRLLAALIADVHDQPNALPLFQYALTELYEHRDGTTLTYADYQAFGGLRRAVPNRADELYASLDPEQQEAARQLFLRLVAVAGDAEGRRRIPAYELTELEVDVVALQAAIEAFGRHRLLTLDRDPATGAPTVEVAHEALLREWRLLRGWLDAARADLRIHRAFVVAVEEWLDSGRNDDYLLTGGRLAEYERWASSTTLRLTTTERAFLDAAIDRRQSAEAAERDRLAAETSLRRRARRRSWALTVSLLTLAGVIAAALLASGDDSTGPTIALYGFDAGVGNSIDDLAIGALDRAARDLDIEPVVIGTSVSDARGSLDELGRNADLVVLGLIANEFLSPELVDAYPDTTWVMLDVPGSDIPNVVSIDFAVEQGSFLVGAAAALESETGVVGFLGGHQTPPIDAFRAGFEAGARAVDPDIEVLAAFVASGPLFGFRSPDRARQVATSLYERGADVVFHAAGESGDGVFEAAAALSDTLGRHLWAIGVDNDQYLELPATLRGHVLTSMVKRFDQGVYETIRAYVDGNLTPGHRTLGLREGAVGYTTSGGYLGDATLERLDQYQEEIAAGRRAVPRLPSGAVDPPLGAPEPTAVSVRWDGESCAYKGPTEWRVDDVMRVDAVNASAVGMELWIEPVDTSFPVAITSAGTGIAPGATTSLTVEIGSDDPLVITCIPVLEGRPNRQQSTEAVELVVRGLAAGTYTTTALGHPLTYTVPEGWQVHDHPGTVAMQPAEWDDWPPIVIINDVRAADQNCDEKPEPGVGATAIDIATWLTTLPALSTSEPTPVEIGGMSGYSLDLRLAEGWTERCEIAGPAPSNPTIFREGSDSNSLEWWVQPHGWTTRYYLLDVPGGGTWAVDVEVLGDQAAWDEHFDAIEPVLESLVIGTAPAK